jgi:DNA (cytosine-5)-methyltransferase 1
VIHVLECTGAKRFVFENVPTLLTIGRSRFDDMCERLEALGFTINYDILNARDFGVPQNRRRLYIVGRRDGSTLSPLSNKPPPVHRNMTAIVER